MYRREWKGGPFPLALLLPRRGTGNPPPPLSPLAAPPGCARRNVAAEIPPPGSPPRAAAPAPAAASPAPAPRPGWLGVLVARESVDVKADSQGGLQTVRVSIGDHVRKGDPIAILDTSLAIQDLAMARSVLLGAQVD